MLRSRIKAHEVLFVLLWSFCHWTANTKSCERVLVCVRNGDDDSCLSTVNRTVTQLSRINNTEMLCASTEIILTGGIHLLTQNLEFRNSNHTIIRSFSMATVTCKNATITFNTRKAKVSIFNMTFHECNNERKVNWDGHLAVTLYFYNVSYEIENTIISNTAGVGLYALNCKEQIIRNCVFHNNSMGNAAMKFWKYHQRSIVSVLILNTTFSHGHNETGGGLKVKIYDKVQCDVRIENAIFLKNKATKFGSHFLMHTVETNPQNSLSICLFILNSQFIEATGGQIYGVTVNSSRINRIQVTIDKCVFVNNSCGALQINDDNRKKQLMENVSFRSISNTIFHNNSRAIHLSCKNFENQQVNISDCMFTAHNLTKSQENNIAALQVDGCKNTGNDDVIIERSYFKRNFGNQEYHSSLYFKDLGSVTLLDVTVENNNCSGILLHGSILNIQDTVTIEKNSAIFGGGINMKSSGRAEKGKNFSVIVLRKGATLNINYNNASTYGGGIFTDQSCEVMACPIKFHSKQLYFAGNRANIGGDIVSGGCLSNCYIGSKLIGSISNFLQVISSMHEQSQSTCAEYPKRIAFCRNITTIRMRADCSDATVQVNAYPGQVFEVSLMVVDEFCIPSKGIIQAKTKPDNGSPIYLGKDNEIVTFKQSRKYCSKYNYSVTGRMPGKSATIQFSFQWQSPTKSQPTLLRVNFVECPKGFKYVEEKGQCDCSAALEAIRVECTATDHSLKVPPRVWIGDYSNKVAINQYCKHCNNGKRKTIYPLNTTNNSDVLCMRNRTGILCGKCSRGYSLQLGGYHCDKCTGSTFIGVLLVIFFLLTGFVLIIMLLGLNLTVSTGVINALVFYSNMVYSNGDSLLPIDIESEKPWLQGFVKFLLVFQAWINLDFGITTCLFEGYDLYDSTWLQFLFPLYIWLLILLIILASKYSNRISKLTTSSTVPVLATLMLLSYTKLLMASISAVSFTKLHFLNDSSTHAVWVLDGNISYLHGKHIPLFLASVLWLVGFILPFTLLILLGPTLQAKSQYRFLNWINKLKPLLDAFYGPYTDIYRYWPGLLLLARLLLSLMAAFYSLGDGPYNLLVITAMVAVLLTIWILLVRSHSVQPYHKTSLNYLELFFLLNLATFSIVSVYFQFTKDNNYHKQVLAVVMVGAIFIVFCGILSHELLRKLWRYKVTKKFIRFIPYCRVFKLFEWRADTERDIDDSSITSYSMTEASGHATHSTMTTTTIEIREPLLLTN